jgi:hypothetical protein
MEFGEQASPGKSLHSMARIDVAGGVGSDDTHNSSKPFSG